MDRNQDGKGIEDGTCVELKYCERCGGLGVRQPGSGQVYCKECLPEIAELPVPRSPRKGAGEAVDLLPELEDYEFGIYDFNAIEFETTGGAA